MCQKSGERHVIEGRAVWVSDYNRSGLRFIPDNQADIDPDDAKRLERSVIPEHLEGKRVRITVEDLEDDWRYWVMR
jgi:hypothetical protein